MPLVTVLSQDSAVQEAVRSPLSDVHSVAVARSWDRLTWLVRERPVTAIAIDSKALPDPMAADAAITGLRRRFPSLATLYIAGPYADPVSLFRLGKAGLGGLVLVPLDGLGASVLGAMGRALRGSTTARVMRALSPRLPAREARAVRLALEGVQRGWRTEDLAGHLGMTRPHVSVRLKGCGLPSIGHLLIWARLLHAGRWLRDPGRSAQSVSRQLDYSSGAAFRRALRNYVGATPTEVRLGRGLSVVLERFLDACGLSDSVVLDRSVA